MMRCVSVVVVSLAAAVVAASGQTGQPAVQAFVGARVIDGSGKPAIENAVLLVRDGRIEALGPANVVRPPAGARTVDLAGKFVIPGLISAHVHVSDVHGMRPRAYTEENTLRQLRVFARYGVTTVWSLGGEQEPAFRARDTQATATLDRARIYLSGDVIVGKTPDDARRMVAEVAAESPTSSRSASTTTSARARRCRRRFIAPSSKRRTAAACAWSRTSTTSTTPRTSSARGPTSSGTASATRRSTTS